MFGNFTSYSCAYELLMVMRLFSIGSGDSKSLVSGLDGQLGDRHSFFRRCFLSFGCGFELECEDKLGNLQGDLDGLVSRDDNGWTSGTSGGVSESLLLLCDLNTCFLGDEIGGKSPLLSSFTARSGFSDVFMLLGILGSIPYNNSLMFFTPSSYKLLLHSLLEFWIVVQSEKKTIKMNDVYT